jgi:hypothetical protein
VAVPIALHRLDAMRRATVAVGAVVLLAALAVTPATRPRPPGDAGGPAGECANTDVGDLIGGLPVPSVVKSFVGAPAC